MRRIERAIDEIKKEGYKIKSITKLSGGINSSTHKIELDSNKWQVLKLCKLPSEIDKRKRYQTEKIFYEYLKKCNVNNVPEVIKTNDKDQWLLLSWLSGIKITKLEDLDIRQIGEFIKSVNDRNQKQNRNKLGYASENGMILQEIIENINIRLNKLTAISTNNKTEEEAVHLVNKKLVTRFIDCKKKLAKESGIEMYWKGKAMHAVASQSDVGVHNIIKMENKIQFFDFEYAGLDDLSKLAADWILQPKYPLNSEQEEILIKSIENNMEFDNNDWQKRLNHIKPFIGLKWCTIMLNDLISRKLERRQLDNVKKYYEYLEKEVF